MNKKKVSLIVAVVALSGCCAQSPTKKAPSRRAQPSPTVIALSDYQGQLLKTLPVTVSGKERLFLFDTGGGVTVITPKVAKAIGCIPHGRMTGYRIEGQRVDLQRCEAVAMTIGGRTFFHQTVGVFDLMKLLPAGWPELSGWIGLQTFERQVITVERGVRLIVETDASARARVVDAKQIRVRPSRQLGGESLDLMVAFESNEGPLWAMLDSGCMVRDMLLAPHAAKTLGLEDTRSDDRSSDLLWTIPAARITLSGPVPITGRAVVKEIIYDGVVCASVIQRWNITLDLKRYRGWVKQ